MIQKHIIGKIDFTSQLDAKCKILHLGIKVMFIVQAHAMHVHIMHLPTLCPSMLQMSMQYTRPCYARSFCARPHCAQYVLCQN
jgi:hypothetical protein